MASPLADFVISIHDGHIVSQGTIKDVIAKDKVLAAEFRQDKEAIELDKNEDAEAEEPLDVDGPAKPKDGKLVVAEEIAEGHVSWKACKASPHSFTVESHQRTLRFSRTLPRCAGWQMALVLLATVPARRWRCRVLRRVGHVVARPLGATIHTARPERRQRCIVSRTLQARARG